MYADVTYYKDVYGGNTKGLTDDDITYNLKRASEIIDVVTQLRLVMKRPDFDKLPFYIQDLVKKATCVAAEYYILNGGYQTLTESNISDDGVSNVAVGRFSYTAKETSTVGVVDGSILDGYPPLFLEYLGLTGLMYTGVRVHC